MRHTRTMLLTAAAGLLLLGEAGAAEVELRLAHWVPAQHPIQSQGFEPWAQSISEASEGRINITIYPAQQLGAAPDHYDMARDGIADITHINPGYQPGRFPIIGHGEIPCLITNAKAGSKALDAWYRAYAEQEMSEVHYCLAHLHSPGTFHSKEKLTHPDQPARSEPAPNDQSPLTTAPARGDDERRPQEQPPSPASVESSPPDHASAGRSSTTGDPSDPSPAVGSSRSATSGSCARAIAIALPRIRLMRRTLSLSESAARSKSRSEVVLIENRSSLAKPDVGSR